nr:metalloregulator ArsR/SmtB family transcription factor [Gorillibacterium massiliense]
MKESDELSTRYIVLTLIKTKGPLSASDITKQIGITNMAVRRHLQSLEKDGLIDSERMHQAMGRPTAVYRSTEVAENLFPKNYHTLTLDLLKELVQETGEEMIDRLFERRKTSLYHKYEEIRQEELLEQRVAKLTGIQNDNGYMANWDKTAEGFTMTEINCPISQIANHYEQACRCELQLFESLLDAEVNRSECLAKGGRSCVYHIRPKT